MLLITLYSCDKSNDIGNAALLSNSKSQIISKKDKLGMTYIYEINLGGEKHGKELIYYSTNKLAEINYYKNGKRTGRTTNFFSNVFSFDGTPSVHYIGYFKNDQQDGKFYKFYDNGKLEIAQTWLEGSIIGRALYFDKSGKLKCCKQYANKKLQFYRCYNSKGQLFEWEEE